MSYPNPANNFNFTPETINSIKPELLNYATYWDYYKRLKLLALSVFEWINLPPSMNERFLERSLYENGLACFINDTKLGFINTRCVQSKELNIYDEATKYTAYANNYNKEYDRDKISLVYNNPIALPTDETIRLFALRLYNCERTIDVNINAQKTPYIIKCSKTAQLTFKNMYKQIGENSPYVFLDENIDKYGEIEVLKTIAPYVADKLSSYKKNLWAEALSFLGINNVDTEKKSHLITAEVDSNNQLVSLSAETMLLTRKQACKEFNDLYGTKIDVRMRTSIDGDVTQDQGEYEDNE